MWLFSLLLLTHKVTENLWFSLTDLSVKKCIIKKPLNSKMRLDYDFAFNSFDFKILILPPSNSQNYRILCFKEFFLRGNQIQRSISSLFSFLCPFHFVQVQVIFRILGHSVDFPIMIVKYSNQKAHF